MRSRQEPVNLKTIMWIDFKLFFFNVWLTGIELFNWVSFLRQESAAPGKSRRLGAKRDGDGRRVERRKKKKKKLMSWETHHALLVREQYCAFKVSSKCRPALGADIKLMKRGDYKDISGKRADPLAEFPSFCCSS